MVELMFASSLTTLSRHHGVARTVRRWDGLRTCLRLTSTTSKAVGASSRHMTVFDTSPARWLIPRVVSVVVGGERAQNWLSGAVVVPDDGGQGEELDDSG